VEHENIIEVFNKVDAVGDREALRALRHKYPGAIFISASRGINLDALREAISDYVARDYQVRNLRTHVSNYKLIGYLYEHAEVLDKRYDDEDVLLTYRAHYRTLRHIDARVAESEKQRTHVA